MIMSHFYMKVFQALRGNKKISKYQEMILTDSRYKKSNWLELY